MEKLIVKKGGFLEKQIWEYNNVKKKGEYKYFKIKEKSPTVLFYLNKVIELENGFTVRDWFKLVINYPALQKLDYFIDSYLEEYKICPQSGCINSENKINVIALQKIIKFENYEDNHNYDSCIFIDVFGQTKDEIHYGIDFLHLKNYLDMPMKLLQGITYRESYKKEEKKDLKTERNNYEIINVYYTLFDLISSFIDEISFHGIPKEKDEKMNELKEIIERIKRGEEKMVEISDKLLWGKEDDS